ncbi:hypothetical protein RSSM_01636 [Rhodopirellula sallentina SM41]|uniref:Uncharacterized protein n=1 Tax=Rhodopirellula sallentina SM41 TaxID=1263870 RepID=M5U678_9BACT|nr:hypothetical protein RSSM_01636 [Rhodopirellula sallentina SM41]
MSRLRTNCCERIAADYIVVGEMPSVRVGEVSVYLFVSVVGWC